MHSSLPTDREQERGKKGKDMKGKEGNEKTIQLFDSINTVLIVFL